MAYDLSVVQKGLKSYLRAKFPEFEFFTNQVPEDEELPRAGEEVPPFFVMQFGPLTPRTRGRSIKGARNDEYYSWVQIVCVSSVEDYAADALALVTDHMIGLRVEGATSLIPDGGMSDYGSRQYSIRPVLFYQTQRFEFGLTQNGLDGRLRA